MNNNTFPTLEALTKLQQELELFYGFLLGPAYEQGDRVWLAWNEDLELPGIIISEEIDAGLFMYSVKAKLDGNWRVFDAIGEQWLALRV